MPSRTRQRHGCSNPTPNPNSTPNQVSAAISACGRAGQLDAALRLLADITEVALTLTPTFTLTLTLSLTFTLNLTLTLTPTLAPALPLTLTRRRTWPRWTVRACVPRSVPPRGAYP
jgi:hypothetical protein